MKVEAQELKVLISAPAMERLKLWVKMACGEISGLGLVERVQEGFLITEVFLPFQNNAGASTDIEAEAVAKLMMEIEQEGRDSSKLKFWWHSHVDMPVFWSNTDVLTVARFRPADFFVSTVLNKRGECKTRVDFCEPLKITFQDVLTDVQIPDQGQEEFCKKMFEERVREDKWTVHNFDPGNIPTREELINLVTTGQISSMEAEEILDLREEEMHQQWMRMCYEG